MSEYQYYEFQAIDRPLTKQEMAEIRSLSTRATITSTRFVNEYHWGDFKGDPLALVKQYYDAFLYLANWGSHQLILRVPRPALDQKTALCYAVEDGPFTLDTTRDHLILSFDSETEEPEDWEEGDGWLGTLAFLRSDIVAGDLRSLYLGWLQGVQEELVGASEVEPPVPPGLGTLSGPLKSLVEFLRIDDDLLQAAAERSPNASQLAPTRDQARRWLRAMSDSEKEDLLLRLACDDPSPLQAEVRHCILDYGVPASAEGAKAQARTVGDLLATADQRRQERKRLATQERQRRQKEQAAARVVYLDSLSGRENQIWSQIESLVGAKGQTEYAEAVRLLVDLQDLAARQGDTGGFQVRLKDLRARNSRKISFINRINQAGLRPV